MRVVEVFKAITRNWLRSRSGLFFSFLFPVLFLLIFGSIFGNVNAGGYNLQVQNNDLPNGSPSALSQQFVAALNATKVLTVTSLAPSLNITDYIKNQTGFFGGDPRILVIPKGLEASVKMGLPVSIRYISSPSDQLAPQVGGVVSSVATAFNFQITRTNPLINLTYSSSSFRSYTQVDYYIPGLIAAFMMTNGVIGLTTVASEFKRTGLTKRLSSTPLTKLEWMVGNVLSQAVLALLLALVMIVLGVAIYHTTVTIDSYTVVSLALGAVLFSGIGMTLAGLVSNPESASGLGNAIAFPMMFLSGTFWPVDIMPKFLQTISQVLPLTYFSDGLRDSMILGNTSAALVNIGITAAFAVAFIALGAKATRWKES